MALLVGGSVAYLGIRALNSCRPVDVLVAVDQSIVEAVQQAVRAVGDDAEECARYQLVAAEPTLANAIGEGAPGLPVVWIPDSSLALGTLDTQPGRGIDVGGSLASSPVVLALPEADVDRYGPAGQPLGWSTLLTHPQPPALPDPVSDRAGLAALTGLHSAIGDEPARPRPAFVAAVLALSKAALPSTGDGFQAMERDGVSARAFLTSEHSVVAHNARSSAAVEAVALRDGPSSLDYPFIRVGSDHPPEMTDAINGLESLLRSAPATQALGAAGLRAPDGTVIAVPDAAERFDNGGRLDAQTVPAAAPAHQAGAETLRLWSSLTLRSRMLAVIDTSGSMISPAGATSRIALAIGAAQGGLSLFSDTSDVGLWSFSSRPPPETPWQELVPLGGLADPVAGAPSRRAALAAAAASLVDRLGGETALYDTALAATRAVRAGYEAGSSNLVVLFTDGRNEAEGSIDLPTVLQTLRAEADPTRPVPLLTIGLGPDADNEALSQMSQATGGRSYVANNAEDIRAVFLDALSQRICRPSC